MGVKGTAKQEADTALTGLDFIQAVISLAKDPKTVDGMRASLIEANTIADTRKKEAEAALQAIADAKIAAEKLESDKMAHADNVAANLKKMTEKEIAVKDGADKLLQDIATAKIAHSARLAEIKAKQDAAEALNAQAIERHKAADQREILLNEAAASLKSGQEKLERDQKAYAEAVTKFNNRKRTLAAAAKDAAEGD